MKQHISIDQFKELSEVNQDRVRFWWTPVWGDSIWFHDDVQGDRECIYYNDDEYEMSEGKKHKHPEYTGGDDKFHQCFPLLSIGQIIQFLYEEKSLYNYHTIDQCMEIPGEEGWHVVLNEDMKEGATTAPTFESIELCDALWDALKDVCTRRKT